jgi:hypothetical protein
MNGDPIKPEEVERLRKNIERQREILEEILRILREARGI